MLKQLLKRPLISEDRWEKTRSFRKQKREIRECVSFEDFHRNYIPRFPIITKGFFDNVPLPKEQIHGEDFEIDKWYADEKLYGATFESQVHVFIAFQFLERSKKILKWNWESKKYRFKEDKKVLKKKRHPCFFITAGFFVFGGRKRPHLTHRHGMTDSITIAVLEAAYEAEKVASDHYVGYSRKAVEERYPNIAYLFSAYAVSEKIHAKNYKRILASLNAGFEEPEFNIFILDTKANLMSASEGELKR